MHNERDLIAIFKETGLSIEEEITRRGQFYKNDQLLADFLANQYRALFYFGLEDRTHSMSPSLEFVHIISRRFIDALTHDPDIELTRTPIELSSEMLIKILRSIPFAVGSEYLCGKWVRTHWRKLSEAFIELAAQTPDSVSDLLTKRNARINISGSVFFHMVENEDEENDIFPFTFLATYSTMNNDSSTVSHVPLKNALNEFKDHNELLLKLLAAVNRAAGSSTLIHKLVQSGRLYSPLNLTTADAYTFLKEIPLYEKCGVQCRIPDWWRNRTQTIRLSVEIGEQPPSSIGLDALMSFEPSLLFGDMKITEEEMEQMLLQSEGLAMIKGKWAEVNHDKLRATLDAYAKARIISGKGSFTFAEAMRMHLNARKTLGVREREVEIIVTNGEWLQTVRKNLMNPSEVKNIMLGSDFHGELRPYQQVGVDWLATMRQLGFGSLLADDMGLGKTVQILALLEYLRSQQGGFKALLILPASLIGNWSKEIERFVPKLRYVLLHAKNLTFQLDEADLFITTYGMTSRIEQLKNHQWDLIILDEAQAIKNPSTKQARSVKHLKSNYRIAMTGTPIENRLSDLWSLFDFLNPGLLGSSREFGVILKEMQNEENYSRIKELVSPFILRRLKTDKSVIADLPDKIELKEYADLSRKQVVLYGTFVRELGRKLETSEGIGRRGLVLSSIIKLKQICNHPDQYMGQSGYEAAHGGKFAKLSEICETIREKRERVLVFTQFREMTEPIARFLTQVFGQPGLVLHGGTSLPKRVELVNKLCGDEYVPFMVLSLKAGGVGLNLTGANHVIHFDRWWNPAIENQATDRAFRIGQTQNVMVHKFITTGTIEEKIDLMIEDKQKIAGDIINSSGEGWITEMSNSEIMRLFTLAN